MVAEVVKTFETQRNETLDEFRYGAEAFRPTLTHSEPRWTYLEK